MKILFCIGSMEKGGAERVMANLANFFVEENECAIVTTIKNEPQYELNKDVKFYSLDEDTIIPKNKIYKNIKRIKNLEKIIKEYNPNLIISFLPEPSYRVLLLKKINKIPVIVSVRNDPKIEYKSLKNKIIMNMLYPLADGFVFQTQEAKEYFKNKIKKKSIIIANPLKEEFVNREIYLGEKEKVIVTVGRLEKQKNHKLLINAYKNIEKEVAGYKLVIYGEGSLRNELEEQIRTLNLTDKVELPGVIENVPEKIEKASLFVLSSDYEGMPNALMEAMALGLPCIATDCPCGGCRVLIKNDISGELVKINDIDSLGESIKSLINSDSKRINIGQNAIKIREKFSPKKINSEWDKYVKSILEK